MTNSVSSQNVLWTKKRWLILAASCLINLCIGSMYAWSSLSAPMAQELGQDLSSVFATANAVSFIAMIIGGLLNDKFGPRWIMMAGGVMFGLGMFFSGYANDVSHLLLSYGLSVGWGMSLVYGCTISNTIKFFPDKRGMVGGLTTASYGISSVIFAPLADWICSFVGARMTFMILGVVFLLAALILMSQSLLGEYIGRMYMTQDQMPQYSVREVVTTHVITEGARREPVLQ